LSIELVVAGLLDMAVNLMYTGLYMTATLTTTEMDGLCTLARIALTPEEKEELTKDLGSILNYVSLIESVVIPDDLDEVHAVHNITRVDTLAYPPREYTDALMQAAPVTEHGYVQVQKIL
jgi:aspartyl/glutamyl-tRNA(Asn/Gln) amidotransferase C subunit